MGSKLKAYGLSRVGSTFPFESSFIFLSKGSFALAIKKGLFFPGKKLNMFFIPTNPVFDPKAVYGIKKKAKKLKK